MGNLVGTQAQARAPAKFSFTPVSVPVRREPLTDSALDSMVAQGKLTRTQANTYRLQRESGATNAMLSTVLDKYFTLNAAAPSHAIMAGNAVTMPMRANGNVVEPVAPNTVVSNTPSADAIVVVTDPELPPPETAAIPTSNGGANTQLIGNFNGGGNGMSNKRLNGLPHTLAVIPPA